MGAVFCPSDGTQLRPKAANPASDPFVGTVLEGRYRVVEPIGSGGMGTVYRALQLNVEREVAVKILRRDSATDDRLIGRFENEARIICRLRHPNILKLIDFGAVHGAPYLVTELLDGCSLAEQIQDRPLSERETFGIIRSVAEALTEAHDKGIVHRDLKPENIFVERLGHRDIVKVLDFGIALLQEATLHTTTGAAYGSPAYMSPEQARGELVDARSDIYSLGLVAYHCLSGRRPFESHVAAALLLNQLHDQPKSFAALNVSSVTPAAERLVFQMLAKDKTERPQSAMELLDAIEALWPHLARVSETLPAIQVATMAPLAPTESIPLEVPKSRPNLWTLALSAAAGAAVAGAIAVGLQATPAIPSNGAEIAPAQTSAEAQAPVHAAAPTAPKPAPQPRPEPVIPTPVQAPTPSKRPTATAQPKRTPTAKNKKPRAKKRRKARRAKSVRAKPGRQAAPAAQEPQQTPPPPARDLPEGFVPVLSSD